MTILLAAAAAAAAAAAQAPPGRSRDSVRRGVEGRGGSIWVAARGQASFLRHYFRSIVSAASFPQHRFCSIVSTFPLESEIDISFTPGSTFDA
jgi:hypothetical protein